MDGDLRNLPRHGPRLHGSPGADICPDRLGISGFCTGRFDHVTYSGHHDRYRAWALVSWRRIYRDIDDRHDCAGRYYRTAIDPDRRIREN